MLKRFLLLTFLLFAAGENHCWSQALQVATSTMKKFSAAGPPGIITNSRLGDLYLNTTDKNIFVCTNRDSYCTTVGTGQWQPFTFIGTVGSIPIYNGVKSISIPLINCKNSATDKLLFDLNNFEFICGTDGGGAGSGISSLNGLTGSSQLFAIGTTGTDFNIVSSGLTHTFHFPTASGTNRGLLSSADWTTFNNKQAALGFTPEFQLTFSGALNRATNNITCLTASAVQFGCLSTTDWSTFNNKQTALGFTPEQQLTFSSPLSRATNTISIPAASSGQNGYLTSADWTTFNSKQAAISGAPGTWPSFAAVATSGSASDLTTGSLALARIAAIPNNTMLGNVSGGSAVPSALTASEIKTLLSLTKSDVGLGNVDNTSDATKNAATATLTNKTLTSPVINSPTGIVKGDVGLGNVDNTSDATKNSATATLTNKTLTTPVIGSYTVAGLPAAGTAGRVAVVTDAATAGSCTSGGGSAISLCRDSGSAWGPLGDGGSGGGGSSVFQQAFGTLSIGASTTSYLITGLTTAGTEANRETIIPVAGTMRDLYIRTASSQAASGSIVFTLRKNGVDTALVVTIASSAAAGTYSDTIDTVSFAAGDRVSLKVQNNATGSGAQIHSFAFRMTF